jgi:hypothetical protein
MLKDAITREPTLAGIAAAGPNDLGSFPLASPARPGLIRPRYLGFLALGVACWVGLFLAFTSIVDPYGVSPLHLSIAGLNVLKPKRVDIDRLIKPYEVWRYQPHTVFLGTSRIQQSIDPATLDGTRFAPAYNASIPASSLGMNISNLEQYLTLDRNLRTVFAELFIYYFLGQGQEHTPRTRSEFLANAATLLGSSDALWASVATFSQNAVIKKETYEIRPTGYFYYPPGHRAGDNFNGFAQGIWKNNPNLALSQGSFDALRDLINTARAHNIELIFLATPNHAYFDYYVDLIGAWDLVEEWLRRASQDATIYSFSQPNDWVYEPVKPMMTYWNDPFHFSLAMGRGIAASLAGQNVPGLPDNFMVRLTPDNAAALVQARRAAIKRWARDNPSFVEEFDKQRLK